MESKVSVIIPVYNTELYLKECLQSVCRQSLTDIEILCINDGSTDGSLSILEFYAVQDSRIRIISQTNQGLSVARNEGIAAAKGQYIQFLDSDDMLERNALEYLVKKMEQDKLDVFYFDARTVFDTKELEQEKNGYKTYYHRENHYQQIVDGKRLFVELMKDDAFRPNACLQLIRRDFLIQSGVTFIPGIVQEDNAFTAELILHAHRVCHENMPFYIRRLRSGSIMTKPSGFINAYGYYRCAVTLAECFSMLDYRSDTFLALKWFCDSLLKNMWDIFASLPDSEKKKIANIPMAELISMRYLLWAQEALKVQANDFQNQLAFQRNKLVGVEDELYHIKNSVSFRVGRKLTFIPRHIRDWVRRGKRI